MCLVLRAVCRRNARGIWLQVISLFIIMLQRTCVILKRLPECNRCCFDVQPRKKREEKKNEYIYLTAECLVAADSNKEIFSS